MTRKGVGPNHVCHNCIGDHFLSNEVKERGILALCRYCDSTAAAVTLEYVATRIHPSFQRHFGPSPVGLEDYEFALVREGLLGLWKLQGLSVIEVIAHMGGLCEKLAGDVAKVLSTSHSRLEVQGIEIEDPYGDDEVYEERSADDWDFRDMWDTFPDEIRFSRRFFSNNAERMLNDIFGDLNSRMTFDGGPVIRQVGPNDEHRFVWRARQALSASEMETILRSPDKEIGPPPRISKGGRMNAPGIRVFYGAMEESTCVAEVRAPVGSDVILARFEFTRSVRLLDLDALTDVQVEGSYFDPHYAEGLGCAAFLKRLVKEMGRPFTPSDEPLEYVPTQAVAEYLANTVTPRIDGIVFRSSQMREIGHNLVLFNHACEIEPIHVSLGADLRVYISRSDEEEGGMVTVFDLVPHVPTADVLSSRTSKSRRPVWMIDYEDPDEPMPPNQPTLRLDPESIAILYIRGLSYDFTRRTLNRYRVSDQFPTFISTPTN